MKQQLYGNIEDIVVKTKFVTPIGVHESSLTPRRSTGPEIEKFLIGSEGIFGVFTEAVVKIHRQPKVELHGSLIFPNMSSAIKFLRKLSQSDFKPSNVRVVCNETVKFFLMLRDQSKISNKIKKIFLSIFVKLNRWNDKNFVLLAYRVEGDERQTKEKSSKIIGEAKKFSGFYLGGKEAKYSYQLLNCIAYLRVSIIKFFSINKLLI